MNFVFHPLLVLHFFLHVPDFSFLCLLCTSLFLFLSPCLIFFLSPPPLPSSHHVSYGPSLIVIHIHDSTQHQTSAVMSLPCNSLATVCWMSRAFWSLCKFCLFTSTGRTLCNFPPLASVSSLFFHFDLLVALFTFAATSQVRK